MLQNAFLPAGRLGCVLLLFLGLLSSCNDDKVTPDPVEAAVPRLKKISYTQNDFQEFTYNADGLLSRYRSQWNLIEDESGEFKTYIVDFQYDSRKRVTQISFGTGGPVKYVYEGDVLKKTEEYDHKGRLVVAHHYTFGAKGRLTEVRDVINDPDDPAQRQLKRTYEYDTKGNVTAVREYHLNVGDDAFVQRTLTTYEGYDDKKNVEGQLDLFPYLPQLRLRVNNPAKKTRTETSNGSRVTWVEEYAYEYHAEGYPIKKVTKITVPGADPVPPRTAAYEYEQ